MAGAASQLIITLQSVEKALEIARPKSPRSAFDIFAVSLKRCVAVPRELRLGIYHG